jgi:hypothetical protein
MMPRAAGQKPAAHCVCRAARYLPSRRPEGRFWAVHDRPAEVKRQDALTLEITYTVLGVTAVCQTPSILR